MNKIDLNGRHAIITGGAKGIGLAIVRRALPQLDAASADAVRPLLKLNMRGCTARIEFFSACRLLSSVRNGSPLQLTRKSSSSTHRRRAAEEGAADLHLHSHGPKRVQVTCRAARGRHPLRCGP